MLDSSNLKVAFIGGGNMAQALIGGFISCGITHEHICVSDPSEQIRNQLAAQNIQVFKDNVDAIKNTDIVIVAVKPQVMAEVLSPLKEIFEDKLIISVVAGVTIETIQNLTGSDKIIRVMPNTPALVKKGAYGMFASEKVDSTMLELVKNVFSSTGVALWVEKELHIDAVTAVSGSGPAYFFYVMNAMIHAGQALGLSKEQAKLLTIQTALGAAEMALQSDVDPAELCKRVTSPNGTTQAALEVFDAAEIHSHIQKALNAANSRSIELAEELKVTS